ncbi:MAG: cyclase family protein [Dehalococcoidia bacterium]|nr:cyclase family protein [Dehalococcoidia bacterium]MDW8119733.1 cyclase family protein [Chloroflexota bacterium]
MPLPRYAELPVIPATGDRHCWGVFGPDDQLGTINFLTPERVRRAVGLVRRGQVFNLSLPLNQPHPPLVPGRQRYRHTLFSPDRNARDEVLDNFYPQFSTQIDGLRHIRYREFGFYGGRQDEDIARGALGIEHWARHGIVGRGVLLDVARWMAQQGRPLDPRQTFPIFPQHLEATARAQSVALEEGDILLVRTGWLGWYLSLAEGERATIGNMLDNTLATPGLDASLEMAAWLWDHRIALVAADNVAVESLPVRREVGFLHRRLIPLLGMPLGEFWDLDALAEDCARDGVYAFLVVAVPLHLPGGVGSPANAIAIK